MTVMCREAQLTSTASKEAKQEGETRGEGIEPGLGVSVPRAGERGT